MLHPAARHLAPVEDARPAAASPLPPVEAGRLHEVLGDGGASGVGVALGWLAEGGAGRHHVWIGRRAWPAATALQRAGRLGDALLIDADSTAERAWAAELCVRCSAVAAVVADGRGFDLTMTRRLQLAARGRDCRLIVLRPAGEGGSSAAGSRWRVTPTPAVAADGLPRHPRWSVELLRSKGGHSTSHGHDAAAGERPAGLPTAGEIFRNEDGARTLGLGAHAWTFGWNPRLGRGLPVGLPPDVAGRPAITTVA